MTSAWEQLPVIQAETAVLSLLAEQGELWAGGAGGVACLAGDAWDVRIADLAVRSVMAFARQDGFLFVAGFGGVARSHNNGLSWRTGVMPKEDDIATALAISPQFAENGTMLAGTLDSGMLRSADSGLTWTSASFGMGAVEITTLRWISGEIVLAGTPEGLFRSTNGGRAWRRCADLGERPIADAVIRADGTIVVVAMTGEIAISEDAGARWRLFDGGMPEDVEVNALSALESGALLLGTSGHGLWRSDTGETWSLVADNPVLALAVDGLRAFAGTDRGLIRSDDGGLTWEAMAPPPVHDLRRIDVVAGVPVVTGIGTTPVRQDDSGQWIEIPAFPRPLSWLGAGWGDSLLASTPEGLFQSADLGESWKVVIEGEAGWITALTILAPGEGWAARADGSSLMKTKDAGASWEQLASPFGVAPLVALQALPEGAFRHSTLLAATYDVRQHLLTVWRSDDGGVNWRADGRAQTEWPGVSMLPDPPTLTMGNLVAVYQGEGAWDRSVVAGTGVRRIVRENGELIALSTSGIWRKSGSEWIGLHDDLAMDRVMDIALVRGQLLCLLAGGVVKRREMA